MFYCEIINLAVRARGRENVLVDQVGVGDASMSYSESCDNYFLAPGFLIGGRPGDGFFFNSK